MPNETDTAIVKVFADSPEHAAHIEFALWDLNYSAMICVTKGQWYVETNAPKNVSDKVSGEFVPRVIPKE